MKITLGLSKNDIERIYGLYKTCGILVSTFDKREEEGEELSEVDEVYHSMAFTGKELLGRVITLIRNEEFANGFDPAVDEDLLSSLSYGEFVLGVHESEDGSTPDVSNDSSDGVLSSEETECIKKVVKELS